MGVRTTAWGSQLWLACFSMAINYDDHPSPNRKQIYLDYFDVLGDILPCLFCRLYYEECKLILPLRKFINDATIEYPVMLWLYLLKDLVNQKLIRQENECYHRESMKIDVDDTLSKRAKTCRKNKLKKLIFYTTPSPPFDEVLEYYLSLKSSCETNDMNKSLQSCRHIPRTKN